jgi:hypothetical protein
MPSLTSNSFEYEKLLPSKSQLNTAFHWPVMQDEIGISMRLVSLLSMIIEKNFGDKDFNWVKLACPLTGWQKLNLRNFIAGTGRL